VRVRAYKLAQNDQGLGRCSPCTGLDGGVAQRCRRRDPAAAHGRSSVRRVLEWRSGRRGSMGRCAASLRSSGRVQGGPTINGDEQLLGDRLTCCGGSRWNSGASRVRGQGLRPRGGSWCTGEASAVARAGYGAAEQRWHGGAGARRGGAQRKVRGRGSGRRWRQGAVEGARLHLKKAML